MKTVGPSTITQAFFSPRQATDERAGGEAGEMVKSYCTNKQPRTSPAIIYRWHSLTDILLIDNLTH